jgi:hypothetical protein
MMYKLRRVLGLPPDPQDNDRLKREVEARERELAERSAMLKAEVAVLVRRVES